VVAVEVLVLLALMLVAALVLVELVAQ